MIRHTGLRTTFLFY